MILDSLKQRFIDAGRVVDLDFFETAYLLNVSERNVKRWFSLKHPESLPTLDAVLALELVQQGGIPPEWYDWRAHGVDADTWRPVSATNLALLLRDSAGAGAATYRFFDGA